MQNATLLAMNTAPRISVQARALHKAVDTLGGLSLLAQYLGVPSTVVREWMFDVGSPPHRVFLRVVDLLLDEGHALSAGPAMSVENDSKPI